MSTNVQKCTNHVISEYVYSNKNQNKNAKQVAGLICSNTHCASCEQGLKGHLAKNCSSAVESLNTAAISARVIYVERCLLQQEIKALLVMQYNASAYMSQQLKKIYSNTAPTLSKYCYCYDTLGVKVNRKKQLQIINQ